MDNTLKDILDSVTIVKNMTELRERARADFSDSVDKTVAYQVTRDNPYCQELIDAYSAFRVFKVLNSLIEWSKDGKHDLDRIYRDLKSQF